MTAVDTQTEATEKIELQTFGLRAMLDIARQELGAEAVQAMLAELGVSLEWLNRPDTWTSVKFAETFMAEMVRRSKDPRIIDRFAKASATAKYLGLLYPLLRAFGTPEAVYAQLVRYSPRLNKAGSYELAELRKGFARLIYRAAPDVEGTGKWFCRSLLVQLESVPTMCGLTRAQSVHPSCIARGDDCCVYELTWRRPPRTWYKWHGLGVGFATGALAASLEASNTFAQLATLGFATLAGTMVGYAFELAVRNGHRTEELTDHQEALQQSLLENEERYRELLSAKSAVDKQVELRTAELTQTTAKLEVTLQQVQSLDRAKTDFFNNVSHELRSPLTLILAPLEDLSAGRAPPGGERAAFEAMRRNASRLLHLINQLLDLAKIDAGKMEIAPRSCDFPALVQGVLQGFEAAAQKKGVRIEWRAPAAMPQVVLDTAWIESALTNLIANALRFTSPPGTVRVLVEDCGSEVAVAVSDDGPGIAQDDHEKIFARFAQGDSSKKAVGGTGIGLALVREAARLHGGDVKVESEPGKGATFRLWLPRRAAGTVEATFSTRPARLLQTLAPDAIQDEPSERSGPLPTSPLVLLVEDNPELREFIADVLAVRYRVRTAIDGAQGLVLARELKPDVIVSDVAMPEMNGYELCRALRADQDTQSTPVLLVTARTEIASVLEGFDAGANDYVLKPFHGRELLARVDVHVRLRRVIQELVQRERQATLGVLAASVAHQIRNPLTTLVSGLPAMRARLLAKLDPGTQDLIAVMLDCATRIERTTSDLMDLSRVDREEGGRYRPSDGLRAAVRMLRARVIGPITVHDEVEDSPETEGRVGEMNHVFLNVLDNAVRAVPGQGVIAVRARTEAGFYCIRIGDSGPGIPDGLTQRIFEPFFTTRQAGEGSGLGLAIARQVMQHCGGDIDVGRSELGGAEFIMRIPVTTANAVARQYSPLPLA